MLAAIAHCTPENAYGHGTKGKSFYGDSYLPFSVRVELVETIRGAACEEPFDLAQGERETRKGEESSLTRCRWLSRCDSFDILPMTFTGAR
jgi:hypothetical protein